MRQTLLFNALEAAQLNINRRNSDLKFYEFGNCYFYNQNKKDEGGLAPYSEKYNLSILISGQENALSWNHKATPSSFFTLKTFAEKILARFGIDIYQSQVETIASDLYTEAVVYTVRGKRLFEMGVVSKKVRGMFDIKSEVYYLEMNFSQLLQFIKHNKVTVKELTNYPEVKRDLALLIDKNITFSQLKQIAEKTEKKLLKRVTLFDVYEGNKLPEGKKSYALGFVFQDNTRTMTDDMTERIMNNFIAQFEKQVGAQIRK